MGTLMRIGIVQFGDYKDAFLRFRNGGPETYYAQRYSVDYVERLSERVEFVGVCSMLGAPAEISVLTDKLHFARTPLLPKMRIDSTAVIAVLENWRIDHLLLHTPSAPILRWALRNKIRVLPVLADSWQVKGVRGFLQARRLAAVLNALPMVGNHNLPASLSLEAIGVQPQKIFPWDWPHALTPHSLPAKRLSALEQPPHVLFVGALTESKGPGDCIMAARILKDAAVPFRMSLVGAGDFEAKAATMIRELDLRDCVTTTGRLAHDAVVSVLASASVSLVPSWSSYAEGLPMTIYEALATRTPLVVSDHPMFRHFLSNAVSARMVPERRPALVAEAIMALLRDEDAYARASDDTLSLWQKVKCDLEWGRLIDAWLEGAEHAGRSLQGFSLVDRLRSAERSASR